MRGASLSLLICFDVVPEDTSAWNPDTAPQAITTKTNGKMGGAPLGSGL